MAKAGQNKGDGGDMAQHAQVLAQWTERDVTDDALESRLASAYEVEPHLRKMADALTLDRGLVLTGQDGVGKTALMHEFVRRAMEDTQGPLAGRRVVQVSLRARAAALAKPGEQMRPAAQELMDALVAHKGMVVPFFRDFHLAYDFDLEALFATLPSRIGAPVLAEARGNGFERMVESAPELDTAFVAIEVPEPSLDHMERILERWTAAPERRRRVQMDAATLAMELCHRFLARSHMPRKVLDFLAGVEALGKSKTVVTPESVMDRFHEVYSVPRFLIDPHIPFDADETEQRFRDEVLGQDEAVSTVVRMMSLIKAGLSDPRRAFGVFLFVGPTGVGKTHIAQILAEQLFGSKDRVVRMNMADYGDPSGPYTVFGNSDAYGIAQKRGVLTQRLAGYPFGVLLLDELEKAHAGVHDRLLQMLDEGAFINGAGESIACRSLIIIATSNAGAEVYRGQGLGFAGSADSRTIDQSLDRMLQRHFRFEFLNRFDQVVHFHPLTRQHIRTIAQREVLALERRSGLRRVNAKLDVDEGVLDYLTAMGYDPHFGARFLKRTIERTLTMAVAEVLVKGDIPHGSRIAVRVHGTSHGAPRLAASLLGKAAPAVAVARANASRKATPKLDRAALLDHVRTILRRAAPHRERLARSREAASRTLEEINRTDFWSNAENSTAVLERYRALDVSIRAEARLDAPLQQLEFAQDDTGVSLQTLATMAAAAERALTDWERRVAEDAGGGTTWLVLRVHDAPLRTPPNDWLEALAAIELAWCARLGLTAAVVAFRVERGRHLAIAIEVEGPGAASYLQHEAGVHRRTEAQQDQRVLVRVFPARRGSHETLPRPSVGPVRKTVGPLGWVAQFQGYVPGAEDAAWFASDAQGLERLLAALPPDDQEPARVVRVYKAGGTGARDLRTGAIVPRWRDVEKGMLHALLDGHQGALQAAPVSP